MKIYEIITEERQQTNEWLEKIFPKVANALGKLATKSPKAQAIELLTQRWAEEIITHGRIITPAEKLIRDAAIAGDKTVISSATKAANKLAAETNYAIFKEALGKNWDTVNKWLIRLGIAVPVGNCIAKIVVAQHKRDAGDPEYQGEKYENYVQVQLTRCVAEIGTVLAGVGMIKLAPWVFSSMPIVGNMLVPKVQILTKPAMTAFIAWMETGPGREAVAQWVLGAAFYESTFGKYASALIKTGYDAINKAIYDATNGTLGSAGPAKKTDATTPGVDATSSDLVLPTKAPAPPATKRDYYTGDPIN